MYRKDHKNEHYTMLAHKEGYPARSVYKLKEMDKKYNLLKRGDRVLDLGSAPGSWLMYISEKIGPQGEVVGIDLEDVNVKKNNLTFIKKDILSLTLGEILTLGMFDAVVADLAPKTTGVVEVDAGKSLELNETVFGIAQKVLKVGGIFLTKIFEGQDTNSFKKGLEKYFKDVKRVKPLAVIKKSREFYILGLGYAERG